MAERTGISWADHTFNPWIGCTKVGPGCDRCYAETLDRNRLSKSLGGGTQAIPIIHWGPGAPRYRTSASNWNSVRKWNRKAESDGQPHRVFCASLADVFDNEIDQHTLADLWDLIDDTPRLTWMLLTKRIGRWMSVVPPSWLEGFPPNIWMGATVVNREEAERDIPKLIQIPARVRWLSIEPQLEGLSIAPYLDRGATADNGRREFDGIQWVITGGESGTDARPFDVDWARELVKECRAEGVPVFVKQLGDYCIWHGCSSPGEHWPPGPIREDTGRGYFHVRFRARAGGDPTEWPEDLRVQEFPR